MMSKDELTAADKKRMRGQAQRMNPSVRVGKGGVSEGVRQELNAALDANGLIKVRFEGDREAVRAGCAEITARTGAELIGQVGKTASFYRPRKLS